MVPWNKLPKDLQTAILTMVIAFGGASASCRWGPVVCDPAPPPSTTPMICDPPPPPVTITAPTPTSPPIICDPVAPPPISTPATAMPGARFQIIELVRAINPKLQGAEVTGTILDANSQPLSEVLVIAKSSSVEFQALTDASGAFFMRLHQPGSYRLIVEGDTTQGLQVIVQDHQVITIVLQQVGPQSQAPLPLAEIRLVDIVWQDGLTFAAETPWGGARYRWSVSGGALIEDQDQVTWQPPAEPGRYLLQVVADWGQTGLAVDAAVLIVEPDGNITLS